jgi:hypothetical protein
MPLAAPALLQQLEQVRRTLATPSPLRPQPVNQQGQGQLPLGKDMIDEPWSDQRDLQRHIDHRAGQRGDRDPAAMGAVNRLEEAGPVHCKAIEYCFSALRDRDLEPGLDLR